MAAGGLRGTLRRRLVLAALAALVLWTGGALAREVRHLQWREAGGGWLDDRPCLWRYGTPPVERLEGFLETLRPHLGQDGDGAATVRFSSRFEGQEALCAYLWAAYLAPGIDLRQGPPDAPLAPAEAWLVFAPGPGPEPPGAVGLAPVRGTVHGTLYRVPR